jgi:hypothetical protein
MHRSTLTAFLAWLALTLPAATVGAQSSGTTGTPLGDWSDVRGTNYVIGTATAQNNVQMWLDPGLNNGTFDAAIVDQELGLLAAHGINSVRIFGSFFAHAADRTEYVGNVRTVLAACRKHGLYVTFVLWDVFGLDGLELPILAATLQGGNIGAQIIQLVDREMALLRQNQPTLPTGWGGTWFASPGNDFLVTRQDPKTWPPLFLAMADAYLDDVAWLFQRDFPDTFLSYDFVNEPDNLTFLKLVNPATMVHITAQLSTYSLDRIAKIHAKARFTMGTADAFMGVQLHRKLLSLKNRGFDYLSYHDYLTGQGFTERALHAAALGLLEKREVVCSEFFTAARQGQLPILLASLDRAGIGGQMWGAVEDRIFVVRYDQAFGRVFPNNPSRWWVRDTGVFRPVADSRSPTSWRYDAKNPVFARALRVWAAQETAVPLTWPTLAWTIPLPNVDPRIIKLTVEGPAGLPVKLLVGNGLLQRTQFPGFSIALLDGAALAQVPIGWTQPTNLPGIGRVSIITRLPSADVMGRLQVQAVLGNDYDLMSWEAASQTLATDVLLLP